MATLPDGDRQRIATGVMRYASRLWQAVGGAVASDIRAAVDYTDDWIDQREGQYNNGLPEPIKTDWTLAQKTLLFCAVAAMRVSKGFLVRIFGEVD